MSGKILRQLKLNFAKSLFKYNRKKSDEVSIKENNENKSEKNIKNIYFQNKTEDKNHKLLLNSNSKELKGNSRKTIQNKNIKNLPPKKSSLKSTINTNKTRASKQMSRNVEIYSKKYSDKNILY